MKGYLHELLDKHAQTLKAKFRTGDVGLKERRERYMNVEDDNAMLNCDCGSAFKDRIHMVGDAPCMRTRGNVLGELWILKG